MVKRIPFVCGLLVGVLQSIYYVKYASTPPQNLQHSSTDRDILVFNFKEPANIKYKQWFDLTRATREVLSSEDLAYSSKSNHLESKYLYNSTTVFCLVLVRNEDYVSSARDTWIHGCNNYTFVSVKTRKKNNRKIAIKRSRENSSWMQLCSTLLNVEGYQWILIVYENTFVVLENLRWFLAAENAAKDHYFGHSVDFWGINYNTGQAGYVISNGTLNKVKTAFNYSHCTARNVFLNKEDFYLGKSLASLKIFPVDTRDSLGFTTFHKYSWQQEFFPSEFNFKHSTYPVLCCSTKSISFQVNSNDNMYLMKYILYNLKLFEFGNRGNRKVTTDVPDSVIWMSFLKKHGLTNTNVSSEEYFQIWQKFIQEPDLFNQKMKQQLNKLIL